MRHPKDSDGADATTALSSGPESDPRLRGKTVAVLESGTKVGRYKIGDPIAAGGFGAVYRCVDDEGRPWALKILHRERLSQEVVERFHREVHVMKSLAHPNIAAFHELGVHDDGRPFMTMELLEGENLRERLKRGRIAPGELLSYLQPLVDALSHAHEKGVIHRDLKPNNVFISMEAGMEERVVLLDFGIAKLLAAAEGDALTTSRHMVGTPTAMAPEQVGRGVIDARTDVYGLGALVFRMLTARPVFRESSAMLIRRMHLSAQVPKVSQLAPVPQQMDNVLIKALAKKPEDRQQSVEQFLDEYKAAIRAGGVVLATSYVADAAAAATPAVAVFLEVLVPSQNMDEADDAILDDVDEILTIGRNHLIGGDYQEVMETGTSLLVVKPIRAEDREQATAEMLRRLAKALKERDTLDPRVHFNVCVDTVADAMVGATVVNEAEVTSLTEWSVVGALDSVVASETWASTLEDLAEPLEGSNGLFVLRAEN